MSRSSVDYNEVLNQLRDGRYERRKAVLFGTCNRCNQYYMFNTGFVYTSFSYYNIHVLSSQVYGQPDFDTNYTSSLLHVISKSWTFIYLPPGSASDCILMALDRDTPTGPLPPVCKSKDFQVQMCRVKTSLAFHCDKYTTILSSQTENGQLLANNEVIN